MAEMKVKLKPFTVPNFVVPERTGSYPRDDPPPVVPLADLDETTVNEMCGEWLAALYEKAGVVSTWRYDN